MSRRGQEPSPYASDRPIYRTDLSPGTPSEETQLIGAVDAQRSDGIWYYTRFVCQANLVGTDWLAYVVFASE